MGTHGCVTLIVLMYGRGARSHLRGAVSELGNERLLYVRVRVGKVNGAQNLAQRDEHHVRHLVNCTLLALNAALGYLLDVREGPILLVLRIGLCGLLLIGSEWLLDDWRRRHRRGWLFDHLRPLGSVRSLLGFLLHRRAPGTQLGGL